MHQQRSDVQTLYRTHHFRDHHTQHIRCVCQINSQLMRICVPDTRASRRAQNESRFRVGSAQVILRINVDAKPQHAAAAAAAACLDAQLIYRRNSVALWRGDYVVLCDVTTQAPALCSVVRHCLFMIVVIIVQQKPPSAQNSVVQQQQQLMHTAPCRQFANLTTEIG